MEINTDTEGIMFYLFENPGSFANDISRAANDTLVGHDTIRIRSTLQDLMKRGLVYNTTGYTLTEKGYSEVEKLKELELKEL